MTPHAVDEKATAKRSYVVPTIDVMVMELESGIAAQSAKVVPHPEKAEISLEWETGIDRETEIIWK